MMNPPDPHLIFYACIAKETTIVAEFNSKDADLGTIALNCLERTPQFHSIFSHSVRHKTYMFYFEKPYVFFGIFDEHLDKPSCISFLKSVSDSFNDILDQNPLKRLESTKPHCFQGDFNPVFHQLLATHADLDMDLDIPQADKLGDGGETGSERSVKEKSTPLLGGYAKKRIFGHFGGGNKNAAKESKVDVSSEQDVGLNREFTLVGSHSKNGLFAVERAKRIWKRQVWIILTLDVIVCVILFVIWLCICHGFECLAG